MIYFFLFLFFCYFFFLTRRAAAPHTVARLPADGPPVSLHLPGWWEKLFWKAAATFAAQICQMVSGGDGESTLRCCINWCRDTSDAVLCGRARRNLRLPAISIPLSPWPSCRGAEPLRSHWCPMPSGCSPFLNTWPFMAVPFLKGLELGLLPGLPAVLTPQGCPVPGTAEGPMGPIRSIVLLLFGQKAKIKKKK